MSDQGTRISASPSTSQSSKIVMRAIRLIVGLRLWEIVAGVATGSPCMPCRVLIERLSGGRGFIARNTQVTKGFRSPALVLLQGRDAVGNGPVIVVHGIDLAESIQSGVRFAGHIERHAHVVAQRQNRFLIKRS